MQQNLNTELAAAAAEGVTDVAATTQEVAAVLDSASPIAAEAHVHGPNCGHDHAHEHAAEEMKEPPKGKYLEPSMIPELDLIASFNNNQEGPIWRKSAQELLTNIAFHAASVPEGGVKLCFVNNEAYKFLLAHRSFRQRFVPGTPEQQKKGIVGLFDTHVVVVCDALWDLNEQVTMHKAMYFCDEVLAPVTEVVIETAVAEPAIEVAVDEVAADVIDKTNGRCINCLDTGCIAGDPDQVCGCPAGQGGNASLATES